MTTLYRSARHLDEFHRRVTEAAQQFTPDYEIVLVNDGSPDDSLAVALAIQQRDPHVRVVDLSRNFGHYAALMAAVRHARGDFVFMLDSDLEEAPEWLNEFHARLEQTGADVVYGVQGTRRGGWLERAAGWFVYEVVARRLGVPLPPNVVTARLMTRRFVDALTQFREREFAILPLCAITGFVQEPAPVVKVLRGQSTYTPGRRVAALVDSIASFSNRPLILVFYLGCLIMSVSLASALVLVWRQIVGRVGVPGYASLVVSVWFLGGLMVFCIGLVGIYLAKVFIEVKQRPAVIVRAEYPGPAEPGPIPNPGGNVRL